MLIYVYIYIYIYVCVCWVTCLPKDRYVCPPLFCVCVCVRERACVRLSKRARVHVCEREHVCGYVCSALVQYVAEYIDMEQKTHLNL